LIAAKNSNTHTENRIFCFCFIRGEIKMMGFDGGGEVTSGRAVQRGVTTLRILFFCRDVKEKKNIGIVIIKKKRRNTQHSNYMK
jgi:hypothetical protein